MLQKFSLLGDVLTGRRRPLTVGTPAAFDCLAAVHLFCRYTVRSGNRQLPEPSTDDKGTHFSLA